MSQSNPFTQVNNDYDYRPVDAATFKPVLNAQFELFARGPNDETTHLGYHPSFEALLRAFDRVTTESPFNRRCCVISTNHLTEAAISFLVHRPDLEWSAPQVDIFHLAHSQSPGCCLYNTPWRKDNPFFDGPETLEGLRERQLRFGMPPELVNLLHLAGAAGIEFIIFDPRAERLDNLETYR